MRRALACLLLVTACGGARPAARPRSTPPATPPPATAPAPATSPPGEPSLPPDLPPPSVPPPDWSEIPSPGPVDYAFPVAFCRVTYGRAHHDYPATDVFADAGCAFVAPVAGRVDEVGRTDRWDGRTDRGADRGGLFVSIVGVDGVRYYGSHLRAVAPGIRPGVRVLAGDELGEVGVTGSARGTPPHLHFGISWPTRPGIWWVRRGMVSPYEYLRLWEGGGDRSPAAAVAAARRAAGTAVPPCESRC